MFENAQSLKMRSWNIAELGSVVADAVVAANTAPAIARDARILFILKISSMMWNEKDRQLGRTNATRGLVRKKPPFSPQDGARLRRIDAGTGQTIVIDAGCQ